MSESSEEKTIRKIKSSIIKYQAYNQTSLMIINYEDCSCMFEVFTEIRKAFSAMFADVTLVWWLRLIYVDSAIIEGVDVGKKRVEVPMIQIHSPTKLDIKRIREFIEKKCIVDLEVRQRLRGEASMNRWCDSIRRNGLSDLNSYFKVGRIRRLAITNK